MDLEVVSLATADEWEAWLEAHPDRTTGVGLALAKKGTTVATVTYSDALDVALCFGWIDGRKERLDAERWVQRFTPRRPRSRWSQINRDRAEALIAAGRMRSAGLREIDRARADGRWDAAYAGQRDATVPDDLAQALAAHPTAAGFFATLDRANRYAVIYRVNEAKRPETRARRIADFVAMLADHRKLHP